MCRTAADAGAVLGVIAGADGNDPTASSLPVPNYLAGLERGLNGLRIGIDPTYNRRGVDDTMMAAVKSALAVFRAMGADVREVTFPNTDGVVDEWTAHCGIETAYAHRDTYPKHKDRYGPALSGLIDLGHSLSATDYQEILLHRHDFCGNVRALFDDIDVLVIPAQSAASPTLQQMETLGEDPGQLSSLLRFTAPTDLTGSPALTMPAGFTKAGMPVAIQLVGRHFEEDILVRAGHAYQRETDWHLQHPAI
jgi:amidase